MSKYGAYHDAHEKSVDNIVHGVPINIGIQWRIRYGLFKEFFDL